MLAVVLATLVKFVIILKIGLTNIWKRTTNLIFLNTNTLLQHALFRISFKVIDIANSKFDLKIKEALHINWRNPNLNAQQNHLVLTVSIKLVSPLSSFLPLFVCLFVCFYFVFHTFYKMYVINLSSKWFKMSESLQRFCQNY